LFSGFHRPVNETFLSSGTLRSPNWYLVNDGSKATGFPETSVTINVH